MINPSVGQSLSQWSGTALSLSISKPIKSFINLMFTSYKWTTSDWSVIQRESGKKPLLIYSPLIDLSYKQTGIGRNFIQMCILYFHHDVWKFPNHHAPSPFQMIFQYFKPFYSPVLNSKWAGTDSSDSPGSLEMESQWQKTLWRRRDKWKGSITNRELLWNCGLNTVSSLRPKICTKHQIAPKIRN